MRETERERERDRERERERERQTNTDREKDRRRRTKKRTEEDRQIWRQRKIGVCRKRYKETERNKKGQGKQTGGKQEQT